MKKTLLTVLLAALCTVAALADELTLMIYAQPQEKAILDQVVARFEATHPGTTVKFISSTQAEYDAKIQAQLAANQLPDVFYLGPGGVRNYVDNGKVLDLAPYTKTVKGVNVDDLYPAALDSYRYDGKVLGQGDSIWAVPKDFGPFALAYNKDLFKKYKTLKSISDADISEFEKDIYSTGFYHNKAKNIIACAAALLDRYDGKLPSDIDELTSLPGVGRKTANVIRGNIFNISSIVVDTHVKRVSKLLGLTGEDDPEKVEYDLMKILPKEQWILYNFQSIAHGRRICISGRPKCTECCLKDICKNKVIKD